ncbi:L-fuculose-phosphate aldolase [Mollisia scopiformis]|uniref:L-fuculose-phosphate aldolase n=1 Tax=Mollisia scopiformis TaxID=149040 RepID=A0A194XI62_MOLSC|nr:L-fuculose-phosphate aldolase [Mollisia scopiformis]KUJ19452.1 L-fuculose-phosphate aldolase [Mollisia scopiformis]
MSASATQIQTAQQPQEKLKLSNSPPGRTLTAAQEAISAGGYTLPGLPTFSNFESHRQWIREHMAAAFRSMGRQGLAEGLAGHISVRDPEHSDRFWMNPLGVHFSMMKASDMVLVDYKGNVVGGNKVAVNAAGFQIHSAVHRARPDVDAACHDHGISGRAWSAFGKPLDMLCQDSCVFYDAHSVYNNFGGVVFEGEEAERLAHSVAGKNKAVILQNHGLLTVGETVDEATYLFQLMERLCEIQLKVEAAAAPGNLEKVFVKEDAAKYTFEMAQDPLTLYQEFQPTFKYELWKSKGELKG